MLSLDPEGLEYRNRKVLQIRRDDDIAAPDNRCGKDMSVIGVWKFKQRNEALITRDQGIPGRLVHQFAGSLEVRAVPVRLILQQIFDPFAVNVGRPSGLI